MNKKKQQNSNSEQTFVAAAAGAAVVGLRVDNEFHFDIMLIWSINKDSKIIINFYFVGHWKAYQQRSTNKMILVSLYRKRRSEEDEERERKENLNPIKGILMNF